MLQMEKMTVAERDQWVWRIATYTRTVAENPWIPEYVKVGIGKNLKQQQLLLFTDLKEIFYGGAAGSGKRLRLDEPVATPGGWTTIGELKLGSELFNERGMVCRVTNLFPIEESSESFRMEFDDGSVIDSCGDHLWKTFDNKELCQLTRLDPAWRKRRRERRVSRATGKRSALFTASISQRNSLSASAKCDPPTGSVRSTREIARTLKTLSGRVNHAIQVADCLDLPDLLFCLDPYLLGVWLGDGTSRAGSVTSMDVETVEPFYAAGFGRGSIQSKPGNKAKTYGIRGLIEPLRILGLFRNKHVPAEYLRGSKSQRLALLQGLMDTDGTVGKSGSVSFTNTNRRIAEGVLELIVSLGWKARMIEGRAKLGGKDCGPLWDIAWTPSEYVFRLERKRSRQKLSVRRTTKFRYVTDCRPCGPCPMRCIEVDSPSHLFLAGRSMIPTHNSVSTLVAAAQFVDVPGYAALLLRENFGDLNKPGAWMDLARQWWYDKSIPGAGRAEWNERDKVWRFPSGATITFGYLDSDNAVYQYDSASFQYCAIDELTSHTEFRYRFMFGRLRRPKEGVLSQVPIRMRSASNPGNKGSGWVNKRFGCSKETFAGRVPGTLYIPATLVDNAGNLDVDEYRSSLALLDPLTRQQREFGNWDAVEGGRFKAEWFGNWRMDPVLRDTMILCSSTGAEVERFRPDQCSRFQTCDPAASTSAAADYFVDGTFLVTPKANLVWWGCHRGKYEIDQQVSVCQSLYRRYRPQFLAVEEVLNQRALAQLLRKSTNPVMVIRAVSPMGRDKLDRATGAITMAASGRIFLPERPSHDYPLEELVNELVRFTGDPKQDGHDDTVDCLSYGCQMLPFVRNHSGAVASKPYVAYASPVAPLSGLK